MSKVVFVFLVAFASQVFASQGPAYQPEDQNSNDVDEYIRLGCGFWDEVWDYINQRMPENTAYRLPSASDETVRWIVRAPDGNWLIAVEWQNRTDRSDTPACIVDRGTRNNEETALAHPVTELPPGFISGRISVPASKRQRTSKSLL